MFLTCLFSSPESKPILLIRFSKISKIRLIRPKWSRKNQSRCLDHQSQNQRHRNPRMTVPRTDSKTSSERIPFAYSSSSKERPSVFCLTCST